MSDGDQVVYMNSMEEKDLSVPFQSKQYLEITDISSTNRVFNGQVKFDLSNLSSLYQFADLSEAYIEAPVRFGIRNPTGTSQTPSSYGTLASMVPKGGWHTFVNSVNVNIGSTNVQSANNFQNLNTSFHILTEWSKEEFEKNKSDLGLAIDDVLYDVDDSSSNAVRGLENTAFSTAYNNAGFLLPRSATQNHGFEERSQQINVDATGTVLGNAILGSSKNSLGVSSAQAGTSAGAGEFLYVCYAVAKWRLKDISDAIAKMPLTKGVKGEITINYNSGKATVTNDTSGVFTVYNPSPTYGNCMPAMCALVPNATTVNTWEIIAEVSGEKFNTSALTTASPVLKSARLYVPLFVGQPSVERSLAMKKEVRYMERFQTAIEVDPLQPYTGTISSGITNPRRVTLYPFFMTTSNAPAPFDAITLPNDPLLSPFTHEGYGCSPLASLRNFQCTVAGKPQFQSPINYQYQLFSQEIATMGLNGGADKEQNSGLIDYRQWRQLYAFHTCDVSRRIEGADGQSVPVQVSFQNATNLKMRVICEIEYEKAIVVDTAFGIIQNA